MKYICLGYYDKNKHEAMTEGELNAMFDECFEYDDHLRANGHVAAEAALQPPETALTPVLEERQSRNHGRSLCGDQGTTRRHRNPRSAGHESCGTAHLTASVPEVR